MPDHENANIRLATNGDLSPIANYLNDEMPLDTGSWLGIMQHWWDHNPAFDDGIPRGWLIETESGIKGFVGNIPTKFQIGDRIISSHNPTTWYVSADYRQTPLSRQLFHEFAKTADDSVSFITTPGAHVVRFYREDLNYQNFPNISRRYFYYVYDHTDFLGLNRSRKLKLRHSLFLPYYRWQQKNRIQRPRSLYQVKQLEQADNHFDALWQQALTSNRLTHCRDSETINWLLAGHRAEEKYLMGCYAGGELIGYGLFMDKQGDGRKALECLDLFSVNDNPRIYSAIISHLIDLDIENVAMLKIPSFSFSISKACRELNLSSETLYHYYMVRYGSDLSRQIETSKDTYLTGIHGDYALF